MEEPEESWSVSREGTVDLDDSNVNILNVSVQNMSIDGEFSSYWFMILAIKLLPHSRSLR